MAKQRSHKRTHFLVDRKYQLQFAIRVFVVVFTVAIISSLIATSILWKNLYQPDLGNQTHLIASCIAVAFFLFVELLLAIPLVYILTIKQSNELIGPVNRIVKTIKQISKGDFSPKLSIRQGEPLEEIARSLNHMTKELQERFPHTRGS